MQLSPKNWAQRAGWGPTGAALGCAFSRLLVSSVCCLHAHGCCVCQNRESGFVYLQGTFADSPCELLHLWSSKFPRPGMWKENVKALIFNSLILILLYEDMQVLLQRQSTIRSREKSNFWVSSHKYTSFCSFSPRILKIDFEVTGKHGQQSFPLLGLKPWFS